MKPPIMAMRAHDAAAKENGDRKSQLFQELLQFKVAAMAVVERNDERLRREPLQRPFVPGAQIIRQRNDMIAGTQGAEMISRPRFGEGVINHNRDLAPTLR